MKIAFFQDLDIFTIDGGAQQNDRDIVLKGIQKGHKFEFITSQNIQTRSIDDVDLVIFSNIHHFPKEYIKEVCQKKPYVFFFHDFSPICKHRLFYPMQDKCKTCINRDFWLPLLKGAKLRIWLSPLHEEAWYFTCPELKGLPRAIIPSAIDTTRFKPVEGVKREEGTVVGLNVLLPFKGRYETYDYIKSHQDLKFTFIGDQQEVNATNCEYIRYVPNSKLPEVYSRFEYLIQLNQSVDPFNRVVMEAYLCGCKIIHNSNIGCLSYPWNYEDREDVRFKLKQASIGFWDELEGVMKK